MSELSVWGPAAGELDLRLVAKLLAVRLVAFDFDGVMTDNRVFVDENGRESVACSRYDGLGIARLRTLGIATCIVSTEANSVVARRAEKLGMPVEQGLDDKVSAIRRFADRCGASLGECAFLGNDVNDLPALAAVGVPVGVADAHPSVLHVLLHRTARRGGHGAVREFCDLVADLREGWTDGGARLPASADETMRKPT